MNGYNERIVTIVVPVYNSDKYLEKCLSSLVAQNYSNIEIVIVDDGSTDGSAAIIDSYAATDSRIKILHKQNEGVSAARNDAIKMATGDYLLFVDGDDYLDADYVSTLVSEADEKDSELVVCGYVTEDTDGKMISRVSPTEYSVRDEAWVYRISAVCSRLYSRKLWDRLGLEFTLEKKVRGEDVPVSILANYCARNVSVVDYAGYHYVQHSGSAMHNFKGMKEFSFPKEAMLDMAMKASIETLHNSREYYVFGIIKMFAQFDLVISRGMDKASKRELVDFFRKFLQEYGSDYSDCWKYVKRNSRNIPLMIRIAIDLFCLRNSKCL